MNKQVEGKTVWTECAILRSATLEYASRPASFQVRTLGLLRVQAGVNTWGLCSGLCVHALLECAERPARFSRLASQWEKNWRVADRGKSGAHPFGQMPGLLALLCINDATTLPAILY